MSGDHLSHDVVSVRAIVKDVLARLTPTQQFFQKLEALFESRRSRDHGSVFLTQKRCWCILSARTRSEAHRNVLQ